MSSNGQQVILHVDKAGNVINITVAPPNGPVSAPTNDLVKVKSKVPVTFSLKVNGPGGDLIINGATFGSTQFSQLNGSGSTAIDVADSCAAAGAWKFTVDANLNRGQAIKVDPQIENDLE